MKSGGTCDIDAVNNDLTQIVDGNYASVQLLQLPLANALNIPFCQFWGARPDLTMPSASNPIVGQVQPTRIQLQQPANAITLVPQALDADGNLVASYPFGSLLNTAWTFQGNNGHFPDTDETMPTGFALYPQFKAGIGFVPTVATFAYGFMRLNGVGAWLQMSLLPWINKFSNIGANAAMTGLNNAGQQPAILMNPSAGFSSISGPISFFDWIGFWDGVGDPANGPNGDNLFILALASINLSVSAAGESLGGLTNYAVPNSTGRKQDVANGSSSSQKAGDILVPPGGRRGPCA